MGFTKINEQKKKSMETRTNNLSGAWTSHNKPCALFSSFILYPFMSSRIFAKKNERSEIKYPTDKKKSIGDSGIYGTHKTPAASTTKL